MTSLELEDILFRKTKMYLNEIGLSISGDVYKKGMRPIVSPPTEHKEDVVVSVLTGTGNELQKGTCIVNIYVPDISNNGTYLQDKSRCLTIEKSLVDLPTFLRHKESVYFDQEDMIAVIEEESLREHFVSLKMRFKVLQN